jgi:hypothetical protein
MAYAIASVSSLADLLTFIRNSCTANGWTLSGNVLHKGTCYVEIVADGVVGLRINGGTGKDGSNLLTGGGPQYAYLGTVAAVPLAFPLSVEAHINASPDEVYIVLNYSTSYYSIMAWGLSDVPGLTGTGVWYHATRFAAQGGNEYTSAPGGINTFSNFSGHCDGAPMFSVWTGNNGSSANNGQNNSFIHHDVDGSGWGTYVNVTFPSSNIHLSPLLASLPNSWNQEAVLLPFPIYVARVAGSKYSLVADLKHIRHTRIDYLAPEDIITLGSDQWKVYPWFRKDASARNGGQTLTHSGTIAYAVRYTGP